MFEVREKQVQLRERFERQMRELEESDKERK